MSIVDWIKEHLLNHNIEELQAKVQEGISSLSEDETLQRMKDYKETGGW